MRRWWRSTPAAAVAVAVVLGALLAGCSDGGDGSGAAGDGGARDGGAAGSEAGSPEERLSAAVEATLDTSFRFESIISGQGQGEVRLAVTEYQPPDRLHQHLDAAAALGAGGPVAGGDEFVPTENITVGNRRWRQLEDGSWESQTLDVEPGAVPADLQWLAALRDPVSVEDGPGGTIQVELEGGVPAEVAVRDGLVHEVAIVLTDAPSVTHVLSDHGEIDPIEAPE